MKDRLSTPTTTRRRLVRAAVATALLLTCGCSPQPPNVVIYLVDTLRWDHLGLYGYERDTSPRLEEFAKDAVVYEAAYSPTSWTKPAVASLLSGRYPSAHGAVKRDSALDADVRLLGEYLREAGYQTAAFVTNPNVLPVWGFERGFDRFHDIESVSQSARADRVNELVFQHLAQDPREPFLLYVHTRDPHKPYDPPAPYGGMWAGKGNVKVAAYDGEVRFNDHHFGRLLDHLEAAGLYRDALIVFTSDHGEELGERGEFGHGRSLFEELVKVPLVIKYPGNRRAGQVVDQPVSLLDVMPTVLSAAGCPPQEGLDGVDLGDGESEDPRPLFLDLNLLTEGKRRVIDGVLLGSFKLIEATEPEKRKLLFDLVADPGEQRNLAPEDPFLANRLDDLLSGFRSGAQSGLNVSVVNARGSKERVAEGVVQTAGRFELPRRLGLEEGDEVTRSEDGTSIRFRFLLKNMSNPIDTWPRWLIDQDRFAVEVEPRDAEIVVEEFRFGGMSGPIFLGRAKRAAGRAPLRVRRDAPRLVVPRVDTLFAVSEERSVVAKPGLYLSSVEAARGERVEMSEELEERLRALGYLR